jgi:hypothetical protein
VVCFSPLCLAFRKHLKSLPPDQLIDMLQNVAKHLTTQPSGGPRGATAKTIVVGGAAAEKGGAVNVPPASTISARPVAVVSVESDAPRPSRPPPSVHTVLDEEDGTSDTLDTEEILAASAIAISSAASASIIAEEDITPVGTPLLTRARALSVVDLTAGVGDDDSEGDFVIVSAGGDQHGTSESKSPAKEEDSDGDIVIVASGGGVIATDKTSVAKEEEHNAESPAKATPAKEPVVEEPIAIVVSVDEVSAVHAKVVVKEEVVEAVEVVEAKEPIEVVEEKKPEVIADAAPAVVVEKAEQVVVEKVEQVTVAQENPIVVVEEGDEEFVIVEATSHAGTTPHPEETTEHREGPVQPEEEVASLKVKVCWFVRFQMLTLFLFFRMSKKPFHLKF